MNLPRLRWRYFRPRIYYGEGWNRGRLMGLQLEASCGPCNSGFVTNANWGEGIAWLRKHEKHFKDVDYPPVEEGEEYEP